MNKKRLALLGLFTLLLVGCKVDLKISGPYGLPVTGTCVLYQSNGSTTTKTFSVNLPASISFEAQNISCTIQNKGGDGTITVSATQGNTTFTWVKQLSPYGSFSISTK